MYTTPWGPVMSPSIHRRTTPMFNGYPQQLPPCVTHSRQSRAIRSLALCAVNLWIWGSQIQKLTAHRASDLAHCRTAGLVQANACGSASIAEGVDRIPQVFPRHVVGASCKNVCWDIDCPSLDLNLSFFLGICLTRKPSQHSPMSEA